MRRDRYVFFFALFCMALICCACSFAIGYRSGQKDAVLGKTIYRVVTNQVAKVELIPIE
jgi:hypothetical protein